MWFKNLKIYRFTKTFTVNTAELNTLMQRMPFRGCGAQESQSMGFVPLLKDSDMLFHENGSSIGFCLQIEQRLLPASVINSELQTVVAKIEMDTGLPVSKKQQKDLKEEVTNRLLPQAFTKDRKIHAIFLKDEQLLIVDSASDSLAETLLACLRKCLESLPVVPLIESGQHHLLTSWVKEGCPDEFQLLNEVELVSTDDEKSVIKVKNHDIQAEEVISHIESGKLVDKVAVAYDDAITGVINGNFDLKRIKYDAELLDENRDIPKDQQAARFDADFVLFEGTLKKLCTSLVNISKQS